MPELFREIQVDLAERSYPIFVGQALLPGLGGYFRQYCPSQRAVVITDETVKPLYAQQVCDSLTAAGVESSVIAVPAGEASKSLTMVSRLFDHMMTLRLERSDAVVALGGGVVGDLAGFAAATFKRGVRFVQIPTTLLAMVDSSIGGKTGINHPAGKNMIGAFYQPAMVLADIETLVTLPRRELGCGLCETVKHAVIQDAGFFDYLDQNRAAILSLDRPTLCKVVTRNCQIKAAVVSQDEQESGLRRILNYGHTAGHPFETLLPDHPYHHGEAVALGIIVENELAVRAGLLKPDDAQRIESLLRSFSLPVRTRLNLPIEELYRAMLQDKKAKANRLVFAVPDRIGHCLTVDTFSPEAIKLSLTHLIDTDG